MYYIVDVETDGDIQGIHSLVCFGAVKVEPELKTTFYGKVKPITENWIPEALAVSGFAREEHLTFDEPKDVFEAFEQWLIENTPKGEPIILVSDNNGFDAPWINWYFKVYLGRNPFGHSSRRLADLFAGATRNMRYKWKKHRVTKHTHNPVDDAKGNAEAMLFLAKEFKIKL